MSYKSNIIKELIEISNSDSGMSSSVINYTLDNLKSPIYACSPSIESGIIYSRIKEYIVNSIINIDKKNMLKTTIGIFVPITIKGGVSGLFLNYNGIYFIINKNDLEIFIDNFINQ